MFGHSGTRQAVRSLVERLIENGLDPQSIPAFVAFLTRAITVDPCISPGEINDLAGLQGGWDVQVDEAILLLAMACLLEVSLRVPDHLTDGSPGFSETISLM